MQLKKIALVAALATGLSTLPAQAEIEVDVDISVGEITILYSFDDIDVDITSAALAGLINSDPSCAAPATSGLETSDCNLGDAGTVNAALSGTGLLATPSNNIVTAVGALSGLNAVSLTLDDVWAVRAVGGTSANTTVGVTLGADNTLTNGAGSTITVAAAAIPGGQDTFADPGLAVPQVGDVELTVDLSAVTAGGNHQGAGDAVDVVYTIEVTGT